MSGSTACTLPTSERGLFRAALDAGAVALRAAELLVAKPGALILDVGSGAGKFCIVGALATDAGFVGIEQRPHLVDAASMLAMGLGAQRARFLAGDAFDADWRQFDGIYLFNPFQEHIGDDAGVIDRSISIADDTTSTRCSERGRSWPRRESGHAS